MKQEERVKRSTQRILQHAFMEFSSRGYADSSVNTICATGNISKGTLYHYFPDKDTLYLTCVRQCFENLLAFLSSHYEPDHMSAEDYFRLRLSFFQQYPYYPGILFDVSAYPQRHLAQQLHEIRQPFDAFNISCMRTILSRHTLAPGLYMDDAIQLFRSFLDFFGFYLRDPKTARQFDEDSKRMFYTLLFGIIARPEQ